ncbi:L-arabinose isomerase [Enterococcus sp. OL5]|uniref:L-arabinose isomerase n=1 Tax=Enterococcus sp. OL5 TaxID=2590214 RepID=UPI00112E215B|nr:L-arabinose isomerase [Enterococcus sp. OL5]TPR55570.1 L-arabinose isomerase [Enterococcus sp. OL5]
MIKEKKYELWFVTGCQSLYGEEVVQQVVADSVRVVDFYNGLETLPYPVKFKAVVKTEQEILDAFVAANADPACGGVITWMHTFSPGKMWIKGLQALKKPLLHLNTQMDQTIPWESFDMDYMNLNQSAHGDREFGFIASRLRKVRKVISGYYQAESVIEKVAEWMNVAVAITEVSSLKIARFGDNMREVAVTEGDKVEAQIKLGWTIDTYAAGDLAALVAVVAEEKVDQLMAEYLTNYDFDEQQFDINAVRYQAKLEIAIEEFLDENGYTAFVTCFQDLHGLEQLPGLAAQNLMAKGYGFGGEGDWKTAGMVRLMKVMTHNQGTSFMEDYIYNFGTSQQTVLGAHMLELCPTLSEEKPKIEVHPLFVGNRKDPARLIFKGKAGSAVVASLVDMGNRFRLVINQVTAVKNPNDLPHLPVASILWENQPSTTLGAEAWILAGAGHHFGFSYHATAEQLELWAKTLGIETILIDANTTIHTLENELRWNELAYNAYK